MAFLEVENISKREQDNDAVINISFTQQHLQKIAIAGTTGSGKTTLLKMIAGLIQPTSGKIKFENKTVIGPNNQLIPGHKAIAYLSQHFELRNNYYVHELLEMASVIANEEANKIYAVCQIQHLLKRRTDQLSGGEKQRIALAKTLVTAPKFLLLDEPFSNLDNLHKTIIKQVIADICNTLKITCIIVSHEAQDILSWANWILIMKNGSIVQQDTPHNIYTKPINEYVAGLLGDYNLIDVQHAAGFARVFNKQMQGKQLMVRPEQITISAATNITQLDTVQQILFYGSYYKVHVLVKNKIIIVQTNNHQFAIGDRVFLSIDPNNIWYL